MVGRYEDLRWWWTYNESDSWNSQINKSRGYYTIHRIILNQNEIPFDSKPDRNWQKQSSLSILQEILIAYAQRNRFPNLAKPNQTRNASSLLRLIYKKTNQSEKCNHNSDPAQFNKIQKSVSLSERSSNKSQTDLLN